MGMEHRLNPRLALCQAVEARIEGSGSKLVVDNISAGGLFVRDHHLPRLQSVDLHIPDICPRGTLSGFVTHSTPTGSGIAFNQDVGGLEHRLRPEEAGQFSIRACHAEACSDACGIYRARH